MSILSSLYHHSIRNKPNDVHNQPPESPAPATPEERAAQNVPAQTQKAANYTDGNATLTASAQKRLDAAAEKNTRPALYYTAQEQQPCEHGVWESPHTVASKLESKEEYPQG